MANLLDSVGQTQEAIHAYERLLERQPDIVVAQFNLARLCKSDKRYAEALAAYEAAIRLDIADVEEVYSNMGVLYSEMHDADRAREMYDRALEIAPEYVPALFNLGGHFEEADEARQAVEVYNRILSIDNGHWESLNRLAYAQKITNEHQEFIDRLESAIEDETEDKVAREGLYFALGKAFDDREQYDKASAAYVAANELGKRRVGPYDQSRTERAFGQLIEMFDADWVKQMATASTAAPIFICGMFRSGSTLLEQMLAAHRLVAAGGELDILPWLIRRDLAPYLQGAKVASQEQLQRVADEYIARVRELIPGCPNITDKRPDNILHLGLIKALFPTMKFIHTKRKLLDNCLSIYFQQLGSAASYAAEMENIAHYYEQQDRLMLHWRTCFDTSIFVVDYEELVESPEPVLRRLLEFLGLEWDAGVLDFQKSRGLVKTASLWQVRQGLYQGSMGRWRNYEPLVRAVQKKYPSDEKPP